MMIAPGQWAPLAGTGFALFGSLFVRFTKLLKQESGKAEGRHECNCSLCKENDSQPETAEYHTHAITWLDEALDKGMVNLIQGGIRIREYISTPALGRLDVDDSNEAEKQDNVVIPGEELRVRGIPETHSTLNFHRDSDARGRTPSVRPRGSSFTSSINMADEGAESSPPPMTPTVRRESTNLEAPRNDFRRPRSRPSLQTNRRRDTTSTMPSPTIVISAEPDVLGITRTLSPPHIPGS
jgi:hypothetical protein